MGRRPVIAVVLTMALFAGACGDDDDTETGTTETTAAGSAQSEAVTVDVDAAEDLQGLNLATFTYFPDKLTVSPGTKVLFRSNDTGEPHSVTFGTIVDEALEAAEGLPPDTPDDKLPPAVKRLDEKVPAMLPEGPGDANQLSANPCFTDAEPADSQKACPKVTQPDLTGKQALYSSGYLPDDAEFEVTLADDIAPGTYSFFCTMHREEMTGTLTVVPEGQNAMSSEEVAEAGRKQLEDLAAKLAGPAKALETATAAKAQAGAAAGPDVFGLVASFGPENAAIKAGESVTWDVQGPHTISFGQGEEVKGSMKKGGDGSWHINEQAFTPVGNPGVPPPQAPGPGGPKPLSVDGGRFDGSGPYNTGFLPGFGPPGTLTWKLTFTKPGTYEYVCGVHPDMEGTVTVS